MSYQVLARKWRPKKFNELMGQEHVVNVLTNALSQQRLHHAYLFTGTRGVGKTTIARIFAKSLNCLTGISTNPCGVCDACVDIDEGRFVDLLEIDAASRTKVDDTREILDNVQYAPSRGRYKVYLIDEVHMLSRSSFNALLKTLEEPPEHVKFILATTDPQKLPITVLSRCLQFHLKALNVHQIKQQLESILSAESVSIDSASLSLLAKSARGSMRDALSLTDQAIAQGQGEISIANVQQMLGGIDQLWPYQILICLIKNDTQALMNLSLNIASYAPNYSQLLAEIIQLLHQVAMNQVVEYQFDLSQEQSSLLVKFTQSMMPDDVQLYYQIAVAGRKDLPYALDEQAAFDMTLLRLAAFKPARHEATNVSETSTNDNAIVFDDVTSTDIKPNASDASSVTSTQVSLPSQNRIEEPDNNQSLTKGVISSEVQKVYDEPQQSMAQDTNKFDNVVDNQSTHQRLHELEKVSETQSENTDNSSQQFNTTDAQDNSTQTESIDSKLHNNTATESPVAAILASRNMLRSKKKQQENNVKKSEDVKGRQAIIEKQSETQQLKEQRQVKTEEFTSNVASLTEPLVTESSTYTPDVIDPATIHSANQVDKWANMIDHMALNGRLRQLAIHATINQSSNDNHLILNLNRSTKHLQSQAAHEQLEKALSGLLKRNITVTIEVVEDTVADPYQIQSDINDKRYQYAKALLYDDNVVQHLHNEFQATLDESSIEAL